MTIALPDGVYIDLSDEVYFAQDRLGSTDLSVLHRDPASWWYGSRHNPDRPVRVPSVEMQFGSALHALVLEGEAVYQDKAVISPFEDFRSKEARIWRDDAIIRGKIIMTEDMDRRVRHMSALILNHPELGPPMREGMSEVAILWTDESGVKLRAKIDKLLPRFAIDLKSYGGDAKGRTIREQCLNLVASRSMDVQRFMYWRARQQMAGLPVVGGSPDQQAWIKRVAAVDVWSWCWIFYRRRDDERGQAPIIQPIIRETNDVTFDSGRRKMEVALANYRAFRDRFGFTVPWALVEEAIAPADHDFPPWLTEVADTVSFPAEQEQAA
ncbi:MAG: PD-(D/E)XK nuclease-like domain-containing protein [Proteobacteria bacterium]|nr:PD-(D/E)XK nuclease-like domain-containing protein [Pseudomonadota bacterium]